MQAVWQNLRLIYRRCKSTGSKNEDTGTGYRDSHAEVPFRKNEIAGTDYE